MKHFEGDDRVMSSGMMHEELQNITKDNIDKLLSQMEVNESEVILWGVHISFIAALWPFVMAYFRNKIDSESLEKVFLHVLGESGVALTSRITYGLIFGPLFAWYLLARGVYLITQSIDVNNSEESDKKTLQEKV